MDICIGYSVSHNPITYLYACAKTFERHLNHSWFQTIISLYHVECRNYKIGNNCQTKMRHRFILCLIQLSVLLNLRQSKKVPPPTFEEKWKSHSLQQPILKIYYQFLTDLFSNKIIRCKLWSSKMSTFSKFNILIYVCYFKNQIESGFETKILCLTFSLCSNQNALKSNFFKLSNCTKVKNGVGFKSSFISL